MAAMHPLVNLPTPRPDHSRTRSPKSVTAKFFWRCKMWFDSTFVFTLLEPWEYFLMLSIFVSAFLLVIYGIIRYLPAHIAFMHARATYYLYGQVPEEHLLWKQWLDTAATVTSGTTHHPGLNDL